MYIKEFRIKNFRSFDKTGVALKFQPGVNAIVGENNVGKSAIISALRIAISIVQYKKDIYFTKSDFHLDSKGVLASEAQFDFYLANVPKYLIEIWKPGTDEGEFHIRFALIKNEKGKEKIKYTIWGGEVEGNQLSTDTLETINLVYLGALRDAENEMRPNRNSKIANLLGALAATPDLKEDLVKELVLANDALMQKEPISKIREIINKNLLSIEHEVLHQQIDIGFIDPKFDSIASSLRTWILSRWSFIDKTSRYFLQIKRRCSVRRDLVREDSDGIFLDVKKYLEVYCDIDEDERLFLKGINKPSFELFQNGLGYNNLLFISTVLGDMSLAQEDILLNLLLAEEPEAHLHPQLQSLIYQFFKEQIENSSKLQIIFTTHSPTLTSQLKVDTINVVCNYSNQMQCFSIVDSNLNDSEKYYLEKYLDVTKSQMLFSRGILLVEGISEALLIPIFAKILNRDLTTYAVEIVNVDGTAFSPFVKVLCNKDTGNSIINCSIVTDDDRCTNKSDQETYVSLDYDFDCSVAELDDIYSRLSKGTESDRCQRVKMLAEHGGVCMNTAYKTLEYELASEEKNIEIILKAIKALHPIAGAKLEELIKTDSKLIYKTIRIWLFIRLRSSDKAQFAQILSKEIEENKDSFIIPKYIKEAIYAVTRAED